MNRKGIIFLTRGCFIFYEKLFVLFSNFERDKPCNRRDFATLKLHRKLRWSCQGLSYLNMDKKKCICVTAFGALLEAFANKFIKSQEK